MGEEHIPSLFKEPLLGLDLSLKLRGPLLLQMVKKSKSKHNFLLLTACQFSLQGLNLTRIFFLHTNFSDFKKYIKYGQPLIGEWILPTDEGSSVV